MSLMQSNFSLKVPGGPRRCGRLLASLRVAPFAALVLPSSSCVRPARSLMPIR
jgi:hypothetical protein